VSTGVARQAVWHILARAAIPASGLVAGSDSAWPRATGRA